MTDRNPPSPDPTADAGRTADGFSGGDPSTAIEPCGEPSPSPRSTDPRRTAWIEIALVDEAGDPVPNERFEITLPDGSKASGRLDADGLARLEGLDPGTCQVCLPDLDRDAWEPS